MKAKVVRSVLLSIWKWRALVYVENGLDLKAGVFVCVPLCVCRKQDSFLFVVVAMATCHIYALWPWQQMNLMYLMCVPMPSHLSGLV